MDKRPKDSTADEPRKGQRWIRLDTGNEGRVMADPIEGWIMVRHSGATPYLVHLTDWHERFERKA